MVCFATSIFRGFLRSGNKKRASRPYIFIHYSAIGERVNENILSYESVSYLCEPAQMELISKGAFSISSSKKRRAEMALAKG